MSTVLERTAAPNYARRITRPCAEALEAVQAAAIAQGFRVPAVIDMAASLKKEGIEREPYAVVEVCHAQIASAVLNTDPHIGALMPCRIAVFQQGEETVLTTVLPSRLLGLFERPELEAAAAQVDGALKAIIDRAAEQA